MDSRNRIKTDEDAKVSVAMPCYNAVNYIDTAVLSVLSQTHRNLELLAYDDGSTDGTYERLLFWAEQDPRIRVEQPYGQNGHLIDICNDTIEDSTGEFYCRLDDDDVFLPRKLENQVRYLDSAAHLSTVAIGALAYSIMDHQDGHIDDAPWIIKYIKPVASYDTPVNEPLKTFNRVIHSTFFTRTETIRETTGYNDIVPVEDWEMMLQIARQGDIYVLPKYEALKRQHENNLSKTAKPQLSDAVARLSIMHSINATPNP